MCLPPGVPPGPEAFRYSCSNNTYTERTDIVIIRIRNVTGDLIAFLSVTEVAHIYIYTLTSTIKVVNKIIVVHINYNVAII